jgi:hypothetical protein
MAAVPASVQPKIIVVPRQLEGFFFERLRERYAARSDVKVVVDRRVGERRRTHASAPASLNERRYGDRRDEAGYWSLGEMPFAGA